MFRIPAPKEELEFTGERFTTQADGEIRHEHFHRYFFALQFCAEREVLDIASGEGYGAALLSTVAAHVTGIDISPEAVRHAETSYGSSTSFYVGRADNLPLPDSSIDVVVSFETLEHLEDHEAFFRDIKRVLRSPGVVIMSSPDTNVYSGEQAIRNPYHLKELSRSDFHALVRRHFAHVAFFAQASVMGSVIAPDSDEKHEVGYQGFRRLHENCFEAASGLAQGMYLICVASDSELPRISAGSFDDRPFQMGLYAELQRRDLEILKREGEIRDIRSELNAAGMRDSELQQTRSGLSAATALLEDTRNRLAEAESITEQRDAELQTLRSRLSVSTALFEQTCQSLASKEHILAQRDSELQIARSGLSAATALFEQTRKRLEDTEFRAEQRDSELLTLRTRLSVATDVFERTCRRLEDIENGLMQRNSESQSAQRSLSESNAQLDRTHESLVKTQLALSVEERKSIDLNNSLKSAQAALEEASLREKSLDTELDKLRIAWEHERESAAANLRMADALRKSLSWRITKPARLAVDLLTGFPGILLKLLYTFPPLSGLGKALAKAVFVWRMPEKLLLLQPNPLFSVNFYAGSNRDLGRDGGLWAHYLAFGADEGRNPHPLFDSKYYLSRNPDVASSGVNPLIHYFEYGAAEGRRPHSSFDPIYYLTRRPDVAKSGMNPLLHYWEHGRSEGILPSAPKLTPLPPEPWPRPIPSKYQSTVTASPEPVSIQEKAPLLSILVPTYNTPGEFLRLALESVRRQTYSRWQLCIYDDGSSSKDTLAVLREYASIGDARILVSYGSPNLGIARASNAAFAMAKGEFVGMLDHDDELEPDALAEVARLITHEPSLDVVYTDQDYVDAGGVRIGTLLKPDWSPELFRGVMYVNHLLIVRTELASQVGAFNPDFDRIQDFEFMLRVSEATSRIGHVRRILYHWRAIPGSVASGANAKGILEPLQAAAVNGHLARCGIRAIAAPHPSLAHRLTLRPMARATFPQVIVAIRGGTSDCAGTLASVLERSAYPNLKVCVPQSLSQSAPGDSRIFCGDWQNVQKQVTGDDFLVLIDGGVEVVTPDWIETLLMYCEQRDVACAAPLIICEGTVWNSGLVLGVDRSVGSMMGGWPPDSDGYAGSLSCAREVSAVSGECMMISGSMFRELRGSSKYYAGLFFDGADIALRGKTSGKRNIVTPRAIVRRVAPASLDDEARCLDRDLFADRWRDVIRFGDPFYNPNFLLTAPGYSVAETSKVHQ